MYLKNIFLQLESQTPDEALTNNQSLKVRSKNMTLNHS